MPVFERDSLAFHYLDEGDPLGRPLVFQLGHGGRIPSAAHRGFPSRPSPTTPWHYDEDCRPQPDHHTNLGRYSRVENSAHKG
jgi:hypothetical protein